MKSVYALTLVNTLTVLSCHPFLCSVGGNDGGAIRQDQILYDVIQRDSEHVLKKYCIIKKILLRSSR